jgi:hypothetical protein
MPAIEAAGRLRLRPAIARITGYVDDSRPDVALLAAQALVRIDPALGVRRVVNEFLRRQDWDVRRMATVLTAATSEIRVALAQAVHHTDARTTARVTELIKALMDEAQAHAVRPDVEIALRRIAARAE